MTDAGGAEHVLAIDQGTSGTKAVVVDGGGRASAVVEVPVHVDHGTDGSVEVDPEVLWRSVVDAGKRALAAAGHPRLAAVALANQGETVLAWDRTSGRPLSRAVVWQDGRSQQVCDRLAAAGHGPRLAQLTGLVLDPYFVAPKLAWLREHVTTEGVVTTTDVWFIHRLCGAFVTDAATASRSLLMDLDTVTWAAEAVEAFGLGGEVLPRIVANDVVVGETGVFGASVPVVGLCVDQQAALFAESCLDPGDTKCTYGTGAFLLAGTGGVPVRSSSGLVGCVAWKLSDDTVNWCLDGQVFTVGSAVTWLQQMGIISAPTDLDALGGAVADSGGAVFVPGLAGLGAPFWAPTAKGAFVGLTLAITRRQLVRSAVEGIAAQVAWLARCVAADLGRPLTRLRVDGGLSRSALLCQLQADLAQVPVERYPSPHATALGVAAFARLGLGMTGSPAEAVGGWEPDGTFEPQMSADEAASTLEAWRSVADAVATW